MLTNNRRPESLYVRYESQKKAKTESTGPYPGDRLAQNEAETGDEVCNENARRDEKKRPHPVHAQYLENPRKYAGAVVAIGAAEKEQDPETSTYADERLAWDPAFANRQRIRTHEYVGVQQRDSRDEHCPEDGNGRISQQWQEKFLRSVSEGIVQTSAFLSTQCPVFGMYRSRRVCVRYVRRQRR